MAAPDPAGALPPVPSGSTLAFPGLLSRYDKPTYHPAPPGFNTPQAEIGPDWRASMTSFLTNKAIQRIDLNRSLSQYPPDVRFDVSNPTLAAFATAQADRQTLANDI